MIYRFMKLAKSAAYLSLVWLTWQWFQGDSSWGFSLGCVLVSGLWWGLTRFEQGHLFDTYFDVFSRLRVQLPMVMGTILAGLALVFAGDMALKVVAGGEVALWLVLYFRYRKNRKLYMTQGHGPLPKGTWVNPPAEALQEGDLILTSGRIASRLHESVGHGEVVVKMPDGKLYVFSSYMEKGAVLQPLDRVAGALLRRGHYVALRLEPPLDDLQREAAPYIVKLMLKRNAEWREQTQKRRDRVIGALPLPASAKVWLAKKFRVTGYDWYGLFTGRLAKDSWTCIGACLEFYHRLGVKTNKYGTGLVGFGTGLLDPIKPVRFLSDRSFRMLNAADQGEFEAQKH